MRVGIEGIQEVVFLSSLVCITYWVKGVAVPLRSIEVVAGYGVKHGGTVSSCVVLTVVVCKSKSNHPSIGVPNQIDNFMIFSQVFFGLPIDHRMLYFEGGYHPPLTHMREITCACNKQGIPIFV